MDSLELHGIKVAAAGFDTVYLHADVECWLVPDTRVVGAAFVVRDAKDQD